MKKLIILLVSLMVFSGCSAPWIMQAQPVADSGNLGKLFPVVISETSDATNARSTTEFHAKWPESSKLDRFFPIIYP